jgi:hypothetical protein
MVDMQGRAAVRLDFDSQIVDRAAGVLAGDLEDEVSARARSNP